MTAEELIEHLARLPKSMPVFVQGYEDGFSEIEIRLGRINLNHNRKSWEGPHEEVATAGVEAALIIRRHNEIAED